MATLTVEKVPLRVVESSWSETSAVDNTETRWNATLEVVPAANNDAAGWARLTASGCVSSSEGNDHESKLVDAELSTGEKPRLFDSRV